MMKKNNGLLIALCMAITMGSSAYGQQDDDIFQLDFMREQPSPLAPNNAESTENQSSVRNPFDDNSQGTITIGSVAESYRDKKKPSVLNSAQAVMPEDLSGIAEKIAAIIGQKPSVIQWQGVSNRLRSPRDVRTLYSQLDYQPLWTQDGKITDLAGQVIQAIQEAPYHALRAETYHSDALSSLSAGQQIAEPAKFDIIISDAFITFKSHLANGIVPPKRQFSTWNKAKEELDFASLYLLAKSNNNVQNILTVYDKDYQILQKAYVEALNAPELEQFVAIPAKKLRPKQSGNAVRILRHRLGLDDSIDIYDDELKQAVKDFQSKNGLKADGFAGRNTLHLLNQSPKNKLQTLAINMERYRWSYIPEGTYIWVNIPAFKMAIRNGDDKLFQSNVIVGRPKRPTPIFSDRLENVVLAPYWNVPSTIFREDKLPKLKRNPNAFSNMQVINTTSGKVVNASSVDWSSGGSGYRLRQKPGARNALGRMKFLFPNKHAIYLHDTPSKRLFKRARRAFSSGCIRVERAEDLAVFLLDDIGYDRKRVKRESRGGRERWIKLGPDRRYPVFLDYYTAWVEDGEVKFSSDLYGYDKKLKKLYAETLQNL